MNPGATRGGILSVVVPVCNEANNILEFARRIETALDQLQLIWEVIFVEDSSTDDTRGLVQRLCRDDERFGAVFLTRSFGHHEALTAGIAHARGDHILMMDGDLQHPPEFIEEMWRAYAEGVDMVFATRRRAEGLIKGVGSWAVNALESRLSDYPIEVNSSVFRLFRRRVAETMLSMPERRRYITGMLGWTGFSSREVFYEYQDRAAGKSKYSLRRMIELGLNALTSFSVRPLRLGIHLGFVFSTLSFLAAFYYVLRYSLVGVPVEGFTSIIVAVFFIGGIILLVLGIIGEYLGNIFIEIKARPLYVIDETINVKRKEDRA